jgi:hypothetical protein
MHVNDSNKKTPSKINNSQNLYFEQKTLPQPNQSSL